MIDAEIVGVVRSPWFSDYGDSADGTLVPSAGLLEQHRAEPRRRAGARLHQRARPARGRAGAASPAFREQLAEVSGRHDIEFFDLAERRRARARRHPLRGRRAAGLRRRGRDRGAVPRRAVDRALRGRDHRRPRGAARGRACDRGTLRTMAAVGPTLAAVLGAAVGSRRPRSSPRAASRWAPPSRFEPSPGTRADLPVLVGGLRPRRRRCDRRARSLAVVAGGSRRSPEPPSRPARRAWPGSPPGSGPRSPWPSGPVRARARDADRSPCPCSRRSSARWSA